MSNVGADEKAPSLSSFREPNTEIQIREADYSKDIKPVVEVYVNAFEDQKQFIWVYQAEIEAHREALRFLFDGRVRLLGMYEETTLLVAVQGSVIIAACGIQPNSCEATLYEKICVGMLKIPFLFGFGSFLRLLSLGEKAEKQPDPYGGLLVMMAVQPKYQGQGIGGKLLKEIIKKWDTEGCGDLRLTTQVKSNVTFYSTYGFRTTGETISDNFTNWSMKRAKLGHVDEVSVVEG